MPRLFIAIDIPEQLVEALSTLKDETLHARWTPAEQYHITLRFLGSVDDMTTASLSEALTEIRAEPFEIMPTELGAFPNTRRPRVLIVKVNPNAGLMDLQKNIDFTCTNLGIERDPKPFNPHITLGRLKEGAGPVQVREFITARADLHLEPFAAKEFHLYQSKVSSKGAVHTVLRTYDLNQGKGLVVSG